MALAHDVAPTILVVEDDLDVQANLRDILELDGYEAHSVHSIKEVLQRKDLSRFTIVLLDGRLPDGTAAHLLPHLTERAPQAAVIIITGYADLDGAVLALRHGAADYILKPINLDVLRSGIKRILEKNLTARRLQEAQQQLLQAERLAAIGRTVASISHESRNELNALGLGLTTLAELVHEPIEAARLIHVLKESQQRLVSIFDEVRSYAAPLRLAATTCNLADIWRRAWQSLKPAWTGRNAEVREQIGDLDLSCHVDPLRMEQVFRNLFENALQAGADPLRIVITCRETRLHGHEALGIEVHDNGRGVAAEQADEIFSPFFSTKSSGTGLGLAISRRIIEAHEGRITLSKACTAGAQFVIELPRRCESQSAPQEQPADAAEESFGSSVGTPEMSRKILVVDDSRSMAEILRSLLNKLGQEQVWLAHDGRSALEMVELYQPEIVFLDISLPDIRGDEVARLLRKQSALQRTTLVALTGHSPEESGCEFDQVFDHYYVKPVSLEIIKEVLQQREPSPGHRDVPWMRGDSGRRFAEAR